MNRESLWHLQNFNLLKALTKPEMERLQNMVDTDWIKRKNPVYLPGDPTRWVYFLKEGLVKLAMTSENGKTVTVALLKPGEVFGELSPGDQPDSSMEAIALKNSYLCRIPRDAFLEFTSKNPDVIMSVNKILGLRIRKIQTAVHDMVLLDVPARLAKLLYSLSETDAEETSAGRRLTLPLTHQEIANLVGASREMVTTVLGRFVDEGLIMQEKRQIIVRKPDRLKQMSQR